MIFIHDGPPKQRHLLVEITNDRPLPRDVSYASITAPHVVRCEISIDDAIVETVFAGAGGSHSWWTPAGGKFFPPDVAPAGLAPNETLRVHVDGPCALRIDWVE